MSVEWTLGELARLVGGELIGEAALPIRGLAPLERAEVGDLSFVATARHAVDAARSRASAFLVPPGVTVPGAAVVRVAQPYVAVATLLQTFHPEPVPAAGIDPTAQVAASARVAADATVMAFVSIGGDTVVEGRVVLHAHVSVGERCRVGEGSILYPHAVLYRDVVLGRRVRIHAGAVLGADGFGYAFDGQHHRKIPQVGRVVVGDDVEIGANTTIDRATLGDTVIGSGTKIDNLVQIGHNAEIGSDTVIVAQVGISGSCRIGSYVVLAGQVGVVDHVTIGDGAQIGGQSGVAGNVPAGAKMLGSPVLPAAAARRVLAAIPRVPELLQTVRRLERRVADLERRLGAAEDGAE